MNLAGKTAIVTGASRGLGPYIAKTLAEKGVKIVAMARDIEGLEKTKSEILSFRALNLVTTKARDKTKAVPIRTAKLFDEAYSP